MTEPRIKAIETRYGGCRFRSRTEARWAVFFDALGIAWEYEREGYELPSGRYLPDFWLPNFESWFEVKGAQPTDIERRLIYDLVESTHGSAYLFWGIPQSQGNGAIWDRWTETDSSAGHCVEECLWKECRECGYLGLVAWWDLPCGHDFDPLDVGPRIAAAYESARSARFGT